MTPDFTIPAGDTPTISGTITGVASIAGYTITLSAKKRITDTSPLFTLTATIDNATSGTFHFSPTAQNTNQPENIYYYDIKVVDNNGVPQHTNRSIFKITKAIT